MKTSVKIDLHEAEDRVLRDGLKLAWIRGRDDCAIVLAGSAANPVITQWRLVLHWDACEVSSILLPSDKIWSIHEVLMSPHFKAAMGHIRLLAEDDAQEQTKKALRQADSGDDGSAPTPTAVRTGKWSLGLSASALAVSVLATAVSFYALSVGLSAHINAAMQQSTTEASPPGIESLMGGMAGLFGDSIRLDASTLGPKGMALLVEAARTGFSLNDQGQMVVMFSDPMCPACRQFEKWIAEDGYQTFSPLMLPIAILHGSREASASVLCSTDQANTWRAVIAGESAPNADRGVCADGLAAVDRNNEIFTALGFTHTPTFVAMNGAILVGARAPQEMAAWARQNIPQGMHSSPPAPVPPVRP